MVLVALAFLPTCFLQDLSLVSFLSMGGLIATLFTASLVFRKATDDLNDDLDSANSDSRHLNSNQRYLLEDPGEGLFGALMSRAESQTELVGPKPFLPLSLLLYQVCATENTVDLIPLMCLNFPLIRFRCVQS